MSSVFQLGPLKNWEPAAREDTVGATGVGDIVFYCRTVYEIRFVSSLGMAFIQEIRTGKVITTSLSALRKLKTFPIMLLKK